MANKIVQQIFPVDNHSIIGGYCPQVIHGLSHPVEYCPLEKAVELGHEVEVEHYDESNKRWYLSGIYPITDPENNHSSLFLHTVRDITAQKQAETLLLDNLHKLKRITEQGIQAIVNIVAKKDPYTAEHQLRVSKLAVQLAHYIGLSTEQTDKVRIAALLHDTGKIAIPMEILNKPGRLIPAEFELIKIHPTTGYEILQSIEMSPEIALATYQHHERINGSGYPQGLKGEQIIFEAKFLAIVDVLEAMVSHRPYRCSLGLDQALFEIKQNRGILYDAELVDSFINLITDVGYNFDKVINCESKTR